MNDDQTLIVIRERSFLELLDLGMVVVRDRPMALGFAALAGIAPFAALNFWLLSDLNFPRAVWLLLLMMEVPWATIPLTIVLGDLMFGLNFRFGRFLKGFAASLPALFICQFLVRGVLVVCILGFLLMPARFCFLNEIVLLERESTWRSLRRSLQISRGIEGELFIRWMGAIALGSAFALCFEMGMQTLAAVMAGGDFTWDEPGLADLSGVMFQIGVWMAVAFFGVVRFLCYIDRRIRLEGWEIELRLKRVGRALEERPA